MEEQEKKQKTLVAFIAGLLIGGLLVWMFNATPEKKEAGEKTDEVKAGEEVTTGGKEEAPKIEVREGAKNTPDAQSAVQANTAPAPTVVPKGAGSISVADQGAGDVVALGEYTMPVDNAWIVVHELRDGGVLGNALGASRYAKADGLTPKTIELLRKTEAGKTYHVVVYAENGDKVFDLKEDVPVMAGDARIEDAFLATDPK